LMEGLDLERLDFGVDEGHVASPLVEERRK
jgi:hypothetical protein